MSGPVFIPVLTKDESSSPLMRRLTDWLVYILVRLLVCFIQALQIETCRTLSWLLAVLACDILRLRQHVIDDNLRHVYTDWSPAQRRRLARRMWHHLVLMVCEVALAHRKIHETNWRQYVSIPDKRLLVEYLLDRRPMVAVSGHLGNFELAGYIAGLLGFPSFTVARPLDNVYLDRYLTRFRESKGQYVLPKQGSARAIEAVLQAGHVITLLADQHAGPKGCWVDFLGRPASCHKAVALFALASGAPLVVLYAKRLDGPLQFELRLAGLADPADLAPELAGVKPLTQWYNRLLEEAIRSVPEQYWWVHRRWKGAPPQRTRRAA